jgi:transcription antitermination factor NusG
VPILEAEASLYPDDLLHEALEEGQDRKWWALVTKSRQEKAVARHLLAREVPFYLPLIPKDNVVRGRRLRAHIPLFSNYLFLYGTPEERVTALQSNRLSQTLPVVDQSGLLHDLSNIRRLIVSGVPLTPEGRLQPGRRVRVKSGVMRGLEGLVTERRSRSRLLVAVDFIESGVSVEIDDCMLEPID